MFELLRKESDGSSTLIRVFADDQQAKIDSYIRDLEIYRAFQEFKRLVEVMKLEHAVAAERALSLINTHQYVTLRMAK